MLVSLEYGGLRLVEPHAVYRSKDGRLLAPCYQIDGYSKSGETQGWKNLPLNKIENAEISDMGFSVRPDYEPTSNQYHEIVCSV